MEALPPIRATLCEPENRSWLLGLLASGKCTSRRQVALAALVALPAAGQVTLPTRQTRRGRRGRPRGLDEAVALPVEVADRVDRVAGLYLCRVNDDRRQRIWNELMRREHPMGCVLQAGAQIRYLIGSDHGWLRAGPGSA